MAKKKLKDTYSYKGWLNSDSFLKRAFAIFGYSLVPMLIVYGIILILFLIIAIVVSLFGLG